MRPQGSFNRRPKKKKGASLVPFHDPETVPDVSPFLGLDSAQPIRSRKEIHLGMSLGAQPFTIPNQFRKHGFIAGSTGRGKTYLAMIIAHQLARHNGLIFLDPKGSAVERLKDMLLQDPRCADRVIYWDITSKDHIIGYNPFKRRPDMNIAVQVDIALEAVLRAWKAEDTTETPILARRLPTLFEIMIRTGNTFLEAIQTTTSWDSRARNKILEQARKTDIPDFMLGDWERLDSIRSQAVLDKEISSTFSRIFRFVRNPQARLILGQTERCIDLREVMDSQNILLINLNPGQGEDLSNLIAMLVLNEIAKLAILRKGEMMERDCYVFCDEYSRFATESVSSSLPYTREYGVWFFLLTQYLGQLGRDEREQKSFLHSIQTNCDFKVVLGGMAPDDSRIMVDTIMSAQLNLQQPKLLRTITLPVQQWIPMVNETIGGSEGETEIDTWSEMETLTDTFSSGTSYGSSTGAKEGISEPADGDPDKVRHTSGTNSGQFQSHQSGEAHASTRGKTKTGGLNRKKDRSWSKTFSRQLVTFYAIAQEVAQFWGLDEQKHKAMAFLQKLPQAVALIELKPESTKLVFIKYLKEPNLLPSVTAAFREKLNRWDFTQSYADAQRSIEEHQAQLYGPPGQPPNAVMDETPFQPKPKSEGGNGRADVPPSDDSPFVF